MVDLVVLFQSWDICYRSAGISDLVRDGTGSYSSLFPEYLAGSRPDGDIPADGRVRTATFSQGCQSIRDYHCQVSPADSTSRERLPEYSAPSLDNLFFTFGPTGSAQLRDSARSPSIHSIFRTPIRDEETLILHSQKGDMPLKQLRLLSQHIGRFPFLTTSAFSLAGQHNAKQSKARHGKMDRPNTSASVRRPRKPVKVLSTKKKIDKDMEVM